MRMLDSFPLPPGQCFRCRMNHPPCVDLERDDEENPHRIQRIYLCVDCAIEAVTMMGSARGMTVIASQTVSDLSAAVNELTIDNQIQAAALDRFTAAAAAMAAFLPSEFLTLAADTAAVAANTAAGDPDDDDPEDDDAYFGPTPTGFPDDPADVDAQVEAELQER